MIVSTRGGSTSTGVADDRDGWRARAACQDADPEVFYPIALERASSASNRRAATARAIAWCEQCPVRERCLKWALDAGEDWGVWGGTLPEERRQIRAAREKTWLRRCAWCRGIFQLSHGKQKYCTGECRRAANHKPRARTEVDQ